MTNPADGLVSVILPAYREEDTIAATVAALRSGLATLASATWLEIIVVDDGSDDETVSRARAAGADRIITLGRNRGKGAAVRAGMLAASGAKVLFTDADLQYPPGQVAAVLAHLTGDTGAAIGVRSETSGPPLRRLSSRGAAWLSRRLVLRRDNGEHFDTQCGLKAFRRDIAQEVFGRCTVDRFAFDVEVILLLRQLRVRTVTHTVAPERSERRSKVKTVRDSVGFTRDLLRIRRRLRQGLYRIPSLPAPTATTGRTNRTASRAASPKSQRTHGTPESASRATPTTGRPMRPRR